MVMSAPAPGRRILSPDEEKRRLSDYNCGLNDRELSDRWGLGVLAVMRWRHTRGLPANFQRQLSTTLQPPDPVRMTDYRLGLNDRQLAAKWGIGPQSVQKWRTARGLPTNCPSTAHLTAEQRAARMLLYSFGYSDRRIAREQGVTGSSIERWRKVLHLRPNGRPGLSPKEARSRRAEVGLLARIKRALPAYLSPADKDDASSDLFMAVLSGAISIAEIEAKAKKFGNKVIDQYASKFGPRSLDEELGDDDGFRMIDMIRDEGSADWLEEMGATAW